MSVWVYKDDQSELVDALALQNMLSAGWSVTKGGKDEAQHEENTDEAEEKALLKELKAKARKRGIKGYGKMPLDELKEKLTDD